MANPVPEIFPDETIEAGAKVVGTGRSDYQIKLTMYWYSRNFPWGIGCARDRNQR